ncbi:polysaccharide deacetylase family protein [Paenibacillus sp. EC2-1]|uniref:polysaccharide deacetylase family protein n=1 Tax=Paenibacillus sp. EC2-1 TaxID=3388665 RepID=UPI003BEEFC45
MVKKTTTLLLAASLLLSACGQNQEGANKDPETGSQTETPTNGHQSVKDPNQEEVTPDANDSTNTNGSSDSSNDKEDTSKEDTNEKQPSEQTPVKPQYHINKVFNIVPNDKATEEKVVLLTFDDGPKDEKMINSLIDTLDKHEAKAIFFVNGYRVKQNPDLLKLIHERGQIIGNHSWDHIDLKKESQVEAKKQIEDVQKIVMDTIGEKPKFFRPPFGSAGDHVKKIANDNNLLFMTWSNGSLDWESKSKNNPEAVINNVMDQLHPGSNILMHELPWTVEALDKLLTKLEKKGYQFVDPQNIELKMR